MLSWFSRPPIGKTWPPTLAGRFTWVIDILGWGIGDYADRARLQPDPRWPARRLPASRLGVAGWYFRRLLGRLLALLARAEAGTLRPPRPARRRSAPAPQPPPEPPSEPLSDPLRGPPPRRERIRLPREFAWLVRRIPPSPVIGNPLIAARAGLEALLADPELLGLLATAPQMGRVLRPLCHALGIETLPEALRPPPPKPRPPDPAREAARAQARATRAKARTEARAEAAWARAFRRSLGLPAGAPRDGAADPPARGPPPPKQA